MNFIEAIVWTVLNIYFEGRGESQRGQMDIVHSVNNRKTIRHLSTVEVITQSNQYSWVNSNAKVQQIISNRNLVRDLIKCAKSAWLASGEIMIGENRGMIDHYFNPNVVTPSWAKDFQLVRIIGKHAFYTSVIDKRVVKLSRPVAEGVEAPPPRRISIYIDI